MIKTTRNQSVTNKKARATSFLTLMFLLCATVSFGQFKVNPNTTFTANNVVSSKEEVNILNSSMLGDDQLVLNGVQQFLETNESSSLPTLRVANADELVIQTELIIRGDLIVESGVLQLQNPVHIADDLMLQNDASVENPHLIIFKNKHEFDKGFASTISSEIFTPTLVLLQINHSQVVFRIAVQNKPFATKGVHLKHQFNQIPFSPPPEKTSLT